MGKQETERHDLIRSVDGEFYCTRCERSWRRQPKTGCAGSPRRGKSAWLRRNEDYARAHDLSRSVDGQFSCTQCQLSWQRSPKTSCAGVPVYTFGTWPAEFYTSTQLQRDLKMQPLDREQPDVVNDFRHGRILPAHLSTCPPT